jgi:hypothetical protein
MGSRKYISNYIWSNKQSKEAKIEEWNIEMEPLIPLFNSDLWIGKLACLFCSYTLDLFVSPFPLPTSYWHKTHFSILKLDVKSGKDQWKNKLRMTNFGASLTQDV